MSSNVKIIAALLGCVALALLWFGRDGEPPASERAVERERPSASSFKKPKRQMLLGESSARGERDEVERRPPGSIKSQLDARSKKIKQRRDMKQRATPGADEVEENFEHWREVALNHPDPDERADALTQIDYDGPEQIAVLVEALQDENSEVRLSALDELWVNVDEPPLDILGPVLSDPDPEVRAEAVRMIAESEEARATELLEAALGDDHEDVRNEAADALDIDEDDI